MKHKGAFGSIQDDDNDDTKEEEKKSINDNEENKFKKGDIVKLIGLKSKEHWNGKLAKIVAPFAKSKQRWPLQLIHDDTQRALLKTNNLVLHKDDGGETEKIETKEEVKVDDKMDEDEDEDKENDINNKHERENKDLVENLLWNNAELGNKNNSMETKMDSFQSLLSEMQQVRDAAKSGKLSDDERRQRAAETTMKLMSYMNLDENEANDVN
eukprot:147512_1